MKIDRQLFMQAVDAVWRYQFTSKASAKRYIISKFNKDFPGVKTTVVELPEEWWGSRGIRMG